MGGHVESGAEDLTVLLVEVSRGGLAPEYAVHRSFVLASAPAVRSISISHPDLVEVDQEVDRRPIRLQRSFSIGVLRRAAVVFDLPRAVLQAVRICRAEQVDVVYSSQARRDILLAALTAAICGKPHIVHLQYPYGPWLGGQAVRLLDGVDHIIAVSEFVRSGLVDDPELQSRTSVVHNPAVLPEAVRSRAEVRSEFGLDDEEVFLLAVGRLDESKGFETLIHAMSLVEGRRPRLVICGRSVHSPGLDDELRLLARNLGVDRDITFAGFRNDVPDLMAAADVFALHNQDEAFGLVFTEAMMAGLPTIGCRSGASPEIVDNGVTGVLVEPGDAFSLASALDKFGADPGLRLQFGEAGRQRAEELFAVDVLTRRWADCLRAAAARRPRGSAARTLRTVRRLVR